MIAVRMHLRMRVRTTGQTAQRVYAVQLDFRPGADRK